ncbi:MAG: hypothetical protein KA296_02850 [Marinobacter sp.]|nr:hypothetical protein [Marinobacter sp.]
MSDTEINKVCVVYHYYEKDLSYVDNLSHFLCFGVEGAADYFIIIADGVCRLDLAPLENVRILSVPNNNYDYGGYSVVLNEFVDVKRYDYFLFVNSSVRGPFLPPCLGGTKRPWFEYFIDKFNYEVGVVGASINILNNYSIHSEAYRKIFGGRAPFPHVQTPVFALNQASLSYLLNISFFNSDCFWTRQEVVSRYEIRLSRCLIGAGWNMKCLLPEYNQFDYRTDAVSDPNPSAKDGDVLWPGRYKGRTVHPYEVMFIKTARGLWPDSYLNALASSMKFGSPLNGSRFLDDLSCDEIKNNYRWFGPKVSLMDRVLRMVKKAWRT